MGTQTSNPFFWLMAASATHNESSPGQVQRCGTFHSKLHIKLHLVKFPCACRSTVRGRSPRRWSKAERSVAAVVTGLTQHAHALALGSFWWREMTDDRYRCHGITTKPESLYPYVS